MIESRNKGEKRKQEEEKRQQGKRELQAKQHPSMHHPKYGRMVRVYCNATPLFSFSVVRFS